MVRGIKGLTERVEFGEPLLGQGIPELVDRHAEAFGDGAAFGLALGGSEPERERIEAGQELFEQASGGELTQLLAVALVAALLILLGYGEPYRGGGPLRLPIRRGGSWCRAARAQGQGCRS